MSDLDVALAQSLMEQKNWQEASKVWQRILRGSNNDIPSTVYIGLGKAYLELGNLKKSEYILELGMMCFSDKAEFLIELARLSSIRKDWTIALKRWECALIALHNQVRPNVYLGLGKAYKEIGLYNRSEQIYKLGIATFPDNFKLQMGYAHLLMKKEDWVQAIRQWHKVIHSNKEDVNYNLYLKLLKCYLHLDCYQSVNYYMRRGLQVTKGLNVNKLIEDIQYKINPNKQNVRSRFVFAGGAHNLGVIEHEYFKKGIIKKYITKICDSVIDRNRIANEKLFNLQIREEFPQLKDITPKFIDYTEFDKGNLSFLTFEKVSGVDMVSAEALHVHKKILSVVPKKYMYSFQMPEFLSPENELFLCGFSTIHEEETNRKIIGWLRKRASELENSSSILFLIERLQNVILGQRLYDELKPDVHYGFFHGDFKSENILQECKTDRCFVIDWTTFGVGPKGLDMTIFFNELDFSFEEVDKSYLANQEVGLKRIEKIIFIYAYIVYRFISMKKRENQESLHDFLQQTIEKMESLAVNTQ
jgi:tetratricopeptide (TPR) repeat protein